MGTEGNSCFGRNGKEERSKYTMGQIRCNKCGKEIRIQKWNRGEDCLKVVKEWGYFSKKDRELHTFYLCEDCYDSMIQGFEIPVQKQNVKEVL